MYMLLSRAAHADGTGAVNDGAQYLLNLDNTYLEIDYRQLPLDQNRLMQDQFFDKDELLFSTFDKLELPISNSITKNNVATGVEIKPFLALDNKVPDHFVFGIINADDYDNGNIQLLAYFM